MKHKYKILTIIITICFALSCVAASAVFAADLTPGGGTVIPVEGGSVEYGNAVVFTSPIEPRTVPALVGLISDWLSGIVGGIAVLMIMVGGFMYVTSSGNPARTKQAFDYIKYSVIGLAIILGANIIISEINSLLYGAGTGSSFFDFVEGAIPWLLGIVLGVAVLMIIYAGFLFMTAGEDSKKLDSAKKTVTYASVGVVIALLSYAIVNFIVKIF